MQFKKTSSILFLTASLFSLNAAAQQNPKLTRYVDPLIGSAKHGHVFVGANVPFGAVQLGPNNIFEGGIGAVVIIMLVIPLPVLHLRI
nr:hypothetical protein [Pedobacter borealis]